MHVTRFSTVVLSMTALAACNQSEPQWAGTITDSAGVKIVANAGEGLWTADEQWTAVEELRIGSIDGEPEYQFGQIGWLDTGSDGRIYVLDVQGQHVKVFSPSGEYERTIGGPGSGPGEIGPAAGGQAFVLVGLGDTILVPDLANQRVNRFASDGTDAGSFPINFAEGVPMSWQSAPNGIAEQARKLFGAGSEDVTAQRDVVLLLTNDGAVTDTLTSFPSGNTVSFAGGIPSWNIYSPETTWAITDVGNVILGVNNEYRLREFNASGTLTRIITMPYEPRLVSDRDRSAVLTFFEELFEDQGVPAAAIGQLMGNVSFGEYLPAFARTVMGPNGTIWIQHVRAASDMTDEQLEGANFLEDIGAPDWDVLAADGRYLGVVTMPDRFAPRVIVGRKIYGVWRDELDVQYAVRLRIEGGEID